MASGLQNGAVYALGDQAFVAKGVGEVEPGTVWQWVLLALDDHGADIVTGDGRHLGYVQEPAGERWYELPLGPHVTRTPVALDLDRLEWAANSQAEYAGLMARSTRKWQRTAGSIGLTKFLKRLAW